MSFPPVPSAFDTQQDRADAAAFLTAARAIIASPDDWAPRCQWARDPDGVAVDAHDPLALRWSATAALRVAARRAGGNAVWLGWTALDNSVGPHFAAFEFAADTTHEQMLRVFDLAIQRLGAEAAVEPHASAPASDPAAAAREDEARFITRLATDLIVAHLTVFQQTKIDGPNVVGMVNMLLCDARRQVAAPIGAA